MSDFGNAWQFGEAPNDPSWALPQTQWVVWGGEVELPALNVIAPDLPFQEVARLELPTPRAVAITVRVAAPGVSIVQLQVTQGIGRVELVREVLLAGNGVLDLPSIPARISRVLVREHVSSAGNNPIVVQVVLAPLYPDPAQRRAPVVR